MLGSLIFTVCAIVLLKRAGISAAQTVAIPALLPVTTAASLLVVAPGYLQSLVAEGSGAAIAGAVTAEILPAAFLTWLVRKRV